MIFGSVCSGVEAASVAWHSLGWKAAWLCEFDKFPSQVLAHHYPDVPNLHDMTKIEERKEYRERTINLLVGGTPCQSFSIAGLRKGLDDDRGNLALKFCRILAEKQPRWFVWENVPGVLSSNEGRDFAAILSGFRECGYGFAYRVLDAQYFGVAQRRRRVFVVGCLGDWRLAAAVLFEQDSLRGYPAPRRQKGERIAPCVTNGPPFSRTGNERVEAEAMIVSGKSHWDGDFPRPTLNQSAKTSGGIAASNQEIFSQRGAGLVPYTSTGFAKYAEGIGTLRAEGGDVGFGSETIIAHTLRGEGFDASEDGTGRGVPLVPICWDEELNAREDISGAVIRGGDGGRHAGVAVPMAFQANASSTNSMNPSEVVPTLDVGKAGGMSVAYAMKTAQTGSNGWGVTEEVTNTLDTSMGIAVAQPVAGFKAGQGAKAGGIGFEEEVSPTLTAADSGTQRSPGLLQGMAVRRLTPRECERLQGFPDDYTLIPIDKKGKLAADGPRYKAMGNSMAVPVMAWIGKRIAIVDSLI